MEGTTRRKVLETGIAIAASLAVSQKVTNAKADVVNGTALTSLLDASDEYIKRNKDRWLSEYVGPFLAIKSISERGGSKEEDERRWGERKEALRFLASKLEKFGVKGMIYEVDDGGKDLSKRKRNAFLVGSRNSKNPKAFTLLQYGHADVKPETPVLKPEDKWSCSPTQFVEKNRPIEEYIQEVILDLGNKKVKDRQICARGAADDKGQLLTYLFALETYLTVAREVPINLKFLFEIGEETGSPLGKDFVKRNRELLRADAVIIEDGSASRYNVPFISYWLRGIIKGNITVKTADNSAHSGGKSYLPNAIESLDAILNQIEDNETGRINFREAYDGIRPLTEEEAQYFEKQLRQFDEASVRKKLGIFRFSGEKDYHPLVRTTQRPAFDVHDISGGSQNTLIANKADAYFTIRIVPGQDPLHIFKGLERKVKEIAMGLGFHDNEVEIKLNEYDEAFNTELSHPIFKAVSQSLMQGYGVDEIDYLMEGGTEPISSAFKKYVSPVLIMTGWGDEGSNPHAKNERVLVDYGIVKGVRSNVALFYNLANFRR